MKNSMVKSVKFRLADLNDIDQLVELRVLMQLEVNGFSKQQVTDEYKNQVKEYFLKAITNKKYFSIVAEVKTKIIGTAGACFYEKPPSISGGTGLVGYVTNVYTNVDYRGKGIGTQMMSELNNLAIVIKADKLHLGATEDGLSIYKAVGFKEPRFVNLEMKFNYPGVK
jgi:ribosomal protein S18 acetylase RimI-like enzyme